ncbi:DUF72 domain-containing protein [Candidatus Fermentibacteria bacterium]|nr:DUF72 domain-containing protein [Candidatus Fermentibacteria bacterium]
MDELAELRIGTSGYSFKDWRGPFYPADLPDSKMLDYYVRFFDCVEINSTYYKILHPTMCARMADRTPLGFLFTVKLHRSITHDRTGLQANIDQFKKSVAPLEERGKLAGVLAQFPWSFRNAKETREHLLLLSHHFRRSQLFVEFRNAGWATPGVLGFLQANGLYFCSVDEPELPGLMPSEAFLTGDKGYVRFHGRNAASWWGGGAEERYHYAYREDELRPWVDRIRTLRQRAAKVFVFFNNCHAGHAARNALLMKRLLGQKSGPEQGDLFDE